MVSSIASTVLGCRQPICSKLHTLANDHNLPEQDRQHAEERREKAEDNRTATLPGAKLRVERELAISQVFRAWDALETAATEKRRELEARGWQSAPPG